MLTASYKWMAGENFQPFQLPACLQFVYGDLSDLRIPDDLSLPADVVVSFYPTDDKR